MAVTTTTPLIASPYRGVAMTASKKGYDACESSNAVMDIENDADSSSDDEDLTESDTMSTSQRILNLAVPALISLAIDPLMTIADTAFVGRYSAPNDPYPLAGLGSAAALLVFSFYVFSFLATATAPLVANRRAAKDELGARLVGGQALSLAIVLGTVLTLVLLIFRHPLLQVMGTSVTGPQADMYADQFLTVRALAAPAVLLCSASNGIMRGYLDTKTPTLILLGSNAVNLILDVILVANLGMGPQGAGIATTVAEWIAALCFLGVLSGKLPSADAKNIRSDTLDDNTKNASGEVLLTVTPLLDLPKWSSIKPLVVAASSVFLRSIVLQVAMSSAAAMAARSTSDGMIDGSGASASVAAHQVALQLWLLCSFLCDALATASQALVADGIGRGDDNAVREVSQTVFKWGLVLGLTLSTFLWIGTSSGVLIDFFTSDEGTRIELSKLLTIVLLAQPLNSFVFAADGVLQGAEEFAYQAKAMALSVMSAFAMFAVLEYTTFGQEIILGGDNDTLVNVWYGLIALQAMRGITSLVKLVEAPGPINLLGKQVL
eukprot:CAMPEP_0201966688 /NCGR_PEP_ID=MMETSP0904-20121228/11584_1 /ASSEMBLY_ACC=CAM_ASM_000553 /TAXON_ID=420261 /ORGANISM="Thalassiosira antarctica, Strain CCMP982" /LENGTH=548 /DNA_ID=CAMNT_0048513971 /DNA_START=55 /DNA_END=1701 /DNA_ORIENTATION=+